VNTHGSGPPVEQPEHFEFTPENIERVQVHLAKYPQGRQWSAVLPLLDLAQRQSGGWLPLAAMNHVADLLEMPHIRVYEVATFYTMFNLRPVGRWFLQACTTTPCWLRGSEEVVATCERKLAQAAPPAETKRPLERWCRIDSSHEAPLPIDDTDGGCDCGEPVKNYRAWSRQIATIEIHE